MYSVVAHQNYGREGRRSKQQQNQPAGAQSTQGSGSQTPGSAEEGRRVSRKARTSLATRFLGFIRKRINPEPEEELDQFNIHVSRYRPEELTKLIKTTKFTRKEIQLIYRGFKQECPTGMVDEDSFKHIFSQFFPQGDASQYAHYVFNTIKHNQTGKISFEQSARIVASYFICLPSHLNHLRSTYLQDYECSLSSPLSDLLHIQNMINIYNYFLNAKSLRDLINYFPVLFVSP
ncbi:uncharacterized protein isoform X2 [Rhodnius prolixus]|uniref:uncharacterized protein isoform X2 n=1 Tax=Rhodnius prolixus TaxID=13249 RepID=UPI003D18D815